MFYANTSALGFPDVVEEEVSRPLPYCRLELSGSMAIPVDTTAPKQPRIADTPAIVLNKLTHLDPTKLLVQKDGQFYHSKNLPATTYVATPLSILFNKSLESSLLLNS